MLFQGLTTLSEGIFPNIQFKRPLVQPGAIPSCPVTYYVGEETNPHLVTTLDNIIWVSDIELLLFSWTEIFFAQVPQESSKKKKKIHPTHNWKDEKQFDLIMWNFFNVQSV